MGTAYSFSDVWYILYTVRKGAISVKVRFFCIAKEGSNDLRTGRERIGGLKGCVCKTRSALRLGRSNRPGLDRLV